MRLTALLLLALASLPLQAADTPPEFADLVQAHNSARAGLGIAPLAWSASLAAEAQRWSDQLSREDCKLRYDPDPKRRETTGQNLYRGFAAAPYSGYKRTGAEAAERWLREGKDYDHATHRCGSTQGSQCGAYLQVIWETTTAIGCGRSRCAAAEVWACHYTPRGGQEDLRPYGNPKQSPVAAAAPPAPQQCGWQGPTPAEQFSDAVSEQLAPP